MPFGPVAESESRLDSKSLLCQKKKTQSPGSVGCDWLRWVQKAMGFGHKINLGSQLAQTIARVCQFVSVSHTTVWYGSG